MHLVTKKVISRINESNYFSIAHQSTCHKSYCYYSFLACWNFHNKNVSCYMFPCTPAHTHLSKFGCHQVACNVCAAI